MSIYLINGPAGTGKTSIGNELKKRGFLVIDTDKVFGYYGNLKTENAVEFPGENVSNEWYESNGWLWNMQKIKEAIYGADKPIFFCGGALNEAKLYPDFTKIFRLVVDPDMLVARIQRRGNDQHTNNPEFIARMLEFLKSAKSDGETLGMIIIDTTEKSIEESVDEILKHTDN